MADPFGTKIAYDVIQKEETLLFYDRTLLDMRVENFFYTVLFF